MERQRPRGGWADGRAGRLCTGWKRHRCGPAAPPHRPRLQGMDVVAAIAALPRVKDNTSSPFFQAGKLSGASPPHGWLREARRPPAPPRRPPCRPALPAASPQQAPGAAALQVTSAQTWRSARSTNRTRRSWWMSAACFEAPRTPLGRALLPRPAARVSDACQRAPWPAPVLLLPCLPSDSPSAALQTATLASAGPHWQLSLMGGQLSLGTAAGSPRGRSCGSCMPPCRRPCRCPGRRGPGSADGYGGGRRELAARLLQAHQAADRPSSSPPPPPPACACSAGGCCPAERRRPLLGPAAIPVR